jgi:hypothetical protein
MNERVPEIRCPRLGHQVALAYCYHQAGSGPCRRLFECWEGILPKLRRVVAKRMTPEEWKRCFESPPTPKMVSLVELIHQARGSGEGDS